MFRTLVNGLLGLVLVSFRGAVLRRRAVWVWRVGVVSSCLPVSRRASAQSKGVKVRVEEALRHAPLATPNALENVLAKSLGLSCVLPVAVPLPLYVPVGVPSPRTGGLNKVDKLSYRGRAGCGVTRGSIATCPRPCSISIPSRSETRCIAISS